MDVDDDEMLENKLKEQHERENEALPKKLRKKFEWTPAKTQQFKNMQEARRRKVELRKLGPLAEKTTSTVPKDEPKTTSVSTDSSSSIAVEPMDVSEDSPELPKTPAKTISETPSAPLKSKKPHVEEEISDDSDMEEFLKLQKELNKFRKARHRVKSLPKTNKRKDQENEMEESEEEEEITYKQKPKRVTHYSQNYNTQPKFRFL